LRSSPQRLIARALASELVDRRRIVALNLALEFGSGNVVDAEGRSLLIA
jgi:hypothetical protein